MRALNKVGVTTLAAGLLCIGHPGAMAATDARGGPVGPPAESRVPSAQFAPTITVLRLDGAKPDSVLEVDRSLNAATGDGGTVGSDREGGPED